MYDFTCRLAKIFFFSARNFCKARIIDAIIITDPDAKESVIKFFLQQGFELRKLILWNDMDGWENFKFQDADGSRVVYILAHGFQRRTDKPLDFNNLQTFTEKLQWLKLYDATPLKSRLVDKFLVRSWVSDKIGAQYLIQLLETRLDYFDMNWQHMNFELMKELAAKLAEGLAVAEYLSRYDDKKLR